MKSRLSALDVRAMVSCLRTRIIGLRLVNVYDISKRVYVLKFARGEEKEHLVLESGVRFHLSEYKRNKNEMPSYFTMKMRKLFRGRVLYSIDQLGVDRVIKLQFGLEKPVYLFAEFYVSGNIVLTDENLKNLHVLRQRHTPAAAVESIVNTETASTSIWSQMKLGNTYPIEVYASSKNLSPFLVDEATMEFDRNRISEFLSTEFGSNAQTDKLKQRTTMKKEELILQGWPFEVPISVALSKIVPFAHNTLISFVISDQLKSINREIPIAKDNAIDLLINCSIKCLKILQSVSCPGQLGSPVQPEGGVKVCLEDETPISSSSSEDEAEHPPPAPKETTTSSTLPSAVVVVPQWQKYRESLRPPNPISGFVVSTPNQQQYLDFGPVREILECPSGSDIIEFPLFSQCVDTYFSKMDIVKVEKSAQSKISNLEQKVEKIRKDQTSRVEALKEQQELSEKHACLVESNIEFVENALQLVQKLKATGVDWDLLAKQIKQQRAKGHPIASHILKLELAQDQFTLLLPDSLPDQEEDGDVDDKEDQRNDCEMVPVPLIVGMNAFENAERLHAVKKMAKTKYVKTVQQAELVIARTMKATQKIIDNPAWNVPAGGKVTIKRIRKTFWFEKFFWFISSDGYLVVAGREAIQNDMLYRKYLKRDDIYVHADTFGAASCIIRNPTGQTAIPEMTLREAAIMSVCRSKAWTDNVLVPAYWVYAHQVSKTPQSGEYIRTGGFIIRGKRNLIVVHKLEVGIALVFHLGDRQSVERHKQKNEDRVAAVTSRTEEKSPAAIPLVGKAVLEDGPTIKEEEEAAQMKETDTSMFNTGEHLSASTPSNKNAMSSESEGDQEDVHVQFGAPEILPTESIDPKVDFENLPPEVIEGGSDSSSDSSDDGESPQTVEEIATGIAGINGSTECVRSFSSLGSVGTNNNNVFLLRNDSADEAPPPPEYVGITSTKTKDLLSHKTPESREALDIEKSDEDEQQICVGSTKVGKIELKDKLVLRKKSVDGGPTPKGFFCDEVPPPKELLSRSQTDSLRSIHSHEDMSLPTPKPPPVRVSQLSKAARRKLKKGKAPNEVELSAASSPTSHVGEESASPVSKAVPKKLSEKASRNQRKKQKKIQTKYKEQSDEEREIAMKLIGAKPIGQQPVETEEPVAKPTESRQTRQMEDVDWDAEDQGERGALWEPNREILDELVLDPLDEDVLLSAIPMVAPLSALRNAKYKATLTPGGSKKGRVSQNIQTAFIISAGKITPQAQLIRQCEVEEFSSVLTQNPVVHNPEVTKLLKQQKLQKKKLRAAAKVGSKLENQ